MNCRRAPICCESRTCVQPRVRVRQFLPLFSYPKIPHCLFQRSFAVLVEVFAYFAVFNVFEIVVFGEGRAGGAWRTIEVHFISEVFIASSVS